MRCEYLFCYENACTRLTAPTLKPRCLLCEKHLAELLADVARYRRWPGLVAVEPVSGVGQIAR